LIVVMQHATLDTCLYIQIELEKFYGKAAFMIR